MVVTHSFHQSGHNPFPCCSCSLVFACVRGFSAAEASSLASFVRVTLDSSSAAGLASLVVWHPFHGCLQCISLLLVNALHAVRSDFSAALVCACEDAVSLNTWLENARAWNRVTRFLALNLWLVAPENVGRSFLRLLSGASIHDLYSVIEEG